VSLPGTGRHAGCWIAAIGGLLLHAQLASAQDGQIAPAPGPGWATIDPGMRLQFHRLLIDVPTRDRSGGWQLAADLGRPAAPLLWDMLAAEKADVSNRVVLLAAALLAGGTHEDDRLFAWLAQQKPMLEERTIAAMGVALGPSRTRAAPQFWQRFLGGAKTTDPLLGVAVRLASVRFPDTGDGAPVLVADDGDPGVAAATAFAGLTVPPSLAARLWAQRDANPHAQLFWRGALLGAARRVGTTAVPDGLLERARELMASSGDAMGPVRAAATWLLAVAGELQPVGAWRGDLPLLRVATGSRASAQRLQPWLTAQAQARDEEPERLAVAYALSRPPQVVLAERQQWSADPRIARHVAVALAWAVASPASGVAPVDDSMPGLPEWSFVRAASGGTVERGATCADARLQAALMLLAGGRLERAPLRALLEETLWRWGSHPQLAPWELERLLLRDLLLGGSRPGGNKYHVNVPEQRRYFPGGLDRNDEFFRIAVELYEFALRPRAPMPAEARLPD
jgi:hypothetical protein